MSDDIDNVLIRDEERMVASVIDAADGKLAGRVRLQKAVYLLDQLGLDSGFHYAYHHYGPYSEELSNATDFAAAFGMIEEEYKHRASDGVRYSVFHAKQHPTKPLLGRLGRERASEVLRKLSRHNSTVLELAATAHWLHYVEKVPNWRYEIVRRKSVKTEDGRLEEAEKLLNELGLKV